MRWADSLLRLVFPPRCVLCRKLLDANQTDLCTACRIEVPEVPLTHRDFPYLDQWTALWYYEGNVRRSLLHYKFGSCRSYAQPYGRFLAMKLMRENLTDFDLIAWVPTGSHRRRSRGFDQVELLARAVGREFCCRPVPLLKKIRNNPAQSGIHGEAARRANVRGVYQVSNPAAAVGKRILLLDDIITTGATAGECARMLLNAGANHITFAAVAWRRQDF